MSVKDGMFFGGASILAGAMAKGDWIGKEPTIGVITAITVFMCLPRLIESCGCCCLKNRVKIQPSY
ncbi:MAG: hypothetical protein ACOVOR_03540 [Rhabdochlamydiaceae bacterium]